MVKNILLMFFLSFVLRSLCYSQSAPLNLTSPVTVSPQAAAFAKYGEIPVSYNSGVPNISIPIYTINAGDINFPIQLSYNASGIKVEEIASSVGLGWNLSYTGNITRQVRGLPDESNYGWHQTGELVQEYINGQITGTDLETFKSNYRAGQIDGEKDIYYFSLPGSASGKFFLDSNNVYTTIPRSNIKIENVDATNLNTGFWKITNDLGVQYIFNKHEYTVTQSFSSTDGSPTNTSTSECVSAWYIGQIIDAKGNKINFNYTGYSSSFRTKAAETQRIVISANYSAPDSRGVVDNYNQISGPKIQSIHWKEGKIVFVYSGTDRLDVTSTDRALSEVSVLDYDSIPVKKYKFSTSYFNNPPYTIDDSTLIYRLKLDSLTEISSKGKKNPPHIFTYNSLLMDHRRSNSQDRWGYFNGKNNTDFVTYFRLINDKFVKFGANKDLDSNYTQANILKRIDYPTGGYTTFDYENNRYRLFHSNHFYTYDTATVATISGDNSGGDEYQYLFTYDDPFTIQQSDTVYQNKAVVRADITGGCDNPNNWVCTVQIILYYPDSTHRFLNNGDTVELPPGNYSLHVRIETEFAHIPFASANVSLKPGTFHPPGNYDEYTGGLRVKRITNNDGVKITGKKEFSYNTSGANYSSGTIGFASPEFDTYNEIVNPYPCYGCNQASFWVYSSSHHYPFIQTNQGGYVSYANVEVQDKDESGSNNGKTEYSFTTFDDYSDFVDPNFPFAHATNYDWTRGSPLKEKYYRRNSDNSFTLIKEKRNGYILLNEFGDTSKRIITGITGACDVVYTEPVSAEAQNAGLKIAKCYTVSDLFYQKSDTTKEYDPDGSANYITTINEYEHSKYPFLLKWQKTKDSKGNVLKTNYRYPYDYTPGGFIVPMQQKNMFAVPIEQYTEKISPANDTSVISGVITSYKTNSLLKDKAFKINTSLPIPRSNFSTSFMNGNDFYPGSYYEPLLLYNKYDTNSNIIEQQKKDDVLMSYIWDYRFNYPVAEVKNADSASIAYTSFEADGKGGWTILGTPTSGTSAITGKKVYSLASGDIAKYSLNPSATYIVSYWSKNGAQTVGSSTATRTGRTVNGWTYYEHKVVPTYEFTYLSGSDTIDELRLYPLGAFMSTYTYDPLIGGTSVCDANSRITYYKYDDFGRLVLIVDQDNNVLKKICYNYKGQSEDCITCINYSPIWQNTATALRCQLDTCGRTGYKEREQVDINPCSSTYNETQWITANYDTTACSPQSCVTLTSYNNSGDQDLVAHYYDTLTHVTYTFPISPLSGQQTLGNIAPGTYNLTITRNYSDWDFYFQNGCGQASSDVTPVTFYNMTVSSITCNSITIDSLY